MDTKELKRKMKFYMKKIESHWASRRRVESVNYMSLLIEFFLVELITSFEKIIEGAVFPYNTNFKARNLYARVEIENQPLGYLIKVFEAYCNDADLIKDLRYFAEIRNKCIHKLFENEIKNVHVELKDFYLFYCKLMIKLLELCTLNYLNLNKSFDFMCHDCIEKDFPSYRKSKPRSSTSPANSSPSQNPPYKDCAAVDSSPNNSDDTSHQNKNS